MWPAVGRSRPPSRLSRVDLPEPDLPSRATFSPRVISSETPRRAQTRTDLPDTHSRVTPFRRTAADESKGDKEDIGGSAPVRYSPSVRKLPSPGSRTAAGGDHAPRWVGRVFEAHRSLV